MNDLDLDELTAMAHRDGFRARPLDLKLRATVQVRDERVPNWSVASEYRAIRDRTRQPAHRSEATRGPPGSAAFNR